MSTLSISANCPAITAALATESGRFGPKIYSKSAYKDPIIRLQAMTRGPWTDGMGDVHNHLTYERSFPTSRTANQWVNIAPSDGDATNACQPPKLSVNFASRTRTSQLRHIAAETGYFCIGDIRNRVMFAEQLVKHRNILTDFSWWIWSERYTTDYYDIAAHNVTINQAAGGIYDNASNGYSATHPANAQLEQYHLDTLAQMIVREGPEDAPAVDLDTGGMVIELILGQEMSDALLRNNPNLRNDLRFAEMGKSMNSELLPDNFPRKRRNFGGFVHNIKAYPRRFAIVNGAYQEVPVWAGEAVTIGTASVINPDWLTAPTEEVILWMPAVYRSKVPAPLGEVSPGWKFNPVSYMGDFVPKNIPDRTCNPDGDQIFWRARFSDAAEPVKPEIGITVLAARCGYPTRGVPCNYEQAYNIPV